MTGATQGLGRLTTKGMNLKADPTSSLWTIRTSRWGSWARGSILVQSARMIDLRSAAQTPRSSSNSRNWRLIPPPSGFAPLRCLWPWISMAHCGGSSRHRQSQGAIPQDTL